jgi:Scaffold protein Nfu/NifU N terminal
MRFHLRLRLLPEAVEGGLQFNRGGPNLDICPLAKALLKVDNIESVYIGKSHLTVRKSGLRPW